MSPKRNKVKMKRYELWSSTVTEFTNSI